MNSKFIVCNYFLGTVVYSLFDLKWDYFFIGEDGWLKNAVNFDDFGERVVLSVVNFVESIDFTMVYGWFKRWLGWIFLWFKMCKIDDFWRCSVEVDFSRICRDFGYGSGWK